MKKRFKILISMVVFIIGVMVVFIIINFCLTNTKKHQHQFVDGKCSICGIDDDQASLVTKLKLTEEELIFHRKKREAEVSLLGEEQEVEWELSGEDIEAIEMKSEGSKAYLTCVKPFSKSIQLICRKNEHQVSCQLQYLKELTAISLELSTTNSSFYPTSQQEILLPTCSENSLYSMKTNLTFTDYTISQEYKTSYQLILVKEFQDFLTSKSISFVPTYSCEELSMLDLSLGGLEKYFQFSILESEIWNYDFKNQPLLILELTVKSLETEHTSLFIFRDNLWKYQVLDEVTLSKDYIIF